ncbi:MAG: hypothetical protein AAF513_12370 [Pseudomonadota bacterium]
MSIGVLNEGPLHAALKARYARGGATEVSVEDFVADAIVDNTIYEIQTGSFSGLQRKLSALVERQRVVLVHPVAVKTTIVKCDSAGAQTRRVSPRKKQLLSIVDELVYIPRLLEHPNFSVEVVLTEEDALRVHDPKLRRRRGGWRTLERRLVAVQGTFRMHTMADLLEFLETDLEEPFGTKELAAALGQSVPLARKVAYCLKHAGVIEMVGKQGNALRYQRC